MNQSLVIISFDQWRGDWKNLEIPELKLPNIEKLATNGIRFNRCYTSSPQCVPARFSWLTGLEPSQMGVTKNEFVDLPKDAPSIVRKIRDKGWSTCIIGKTHWTKHNVKGDIRDKKELIKQLGFNEVIEVVGPRALQIIECDLTDKWKREGFYLRYKQDMHKRYAGGRTQEAWKNRVSVLPPHLYPDIWITNQSIYKLKKLRDEAKPWLLWISFVGPHEPFDTPWPWRAVTKKENISRAVRKRNWLDHINKNTTMGRAVSKWKGKISEEEIRQLRIDYADQLKLLDDQIGKIMKTISNYHRNKDVDILVMADHGEMLGDGGMLYKSTFFESAINVPMIYKPSKNKNQSTEINSVTPLTKTFQRIVEHMYTQENTEDLKKWLMKGRKAVIEYEDERAFILGHKKVCLDNMGKLLWATDTKKDPEEMINLAHGGKIKGGKWEELLSWARNETRIRNKKNWIWRDLTKEMCDRDEGESMTVGTDQAKQTKNGNSQYHH